MWYKTRVMKIVLLIFIIGILGFVGYLTVFSRQTKHTVSQTISPPSKEKTANMTISSTAFQNNASIPDVYSCNGENINPPLEFSDIPQNAKSLVLIMDDPDAPMGTWVHWTIFNMNPTEKGIAEKNKPSSGTEGMTSFGKPGYGGPCPPSGTHRYFFKLYALDSILNLDEKADKKAIEEKMQGHILEEAQLVGLYSHK